LNEHALFQKSGEVEKGGFYLEGFGIRARFYRVWSNTMPILKFKYADAVHVFNKYQIFPMQKVFDVSAYFLVRNSLTSSKDGCQPISHSPFLSFNRWARSILFFYRPLKTMYERRRS